MTVKLRALLGSDIHAVLALDTATNPHPWSHTQWQQALEAHDCIALDRDGALAGFAVTNTVLDEAELLLIAVDPALQRQGLGTQLLSAVINALRSRDVAKLFLEVRAGNAAAQALYAKAGGLRIGLRKDYYPGADGSREDAVNYAFTLHAPSNGTEP